MSFKGYIEKVVRDAFEAEGRKYRRHEIISATYADGSKALFIFGVGHYERVRRRIEYRLERNLPKHFPQFAGYEIMACDGTGASGTKYRYMDEDGNETHPAASAGEITLKIFNNE